MTGVTRTVQAGLGRNAEANGRTVPFFQRATAHDIFACFRLLLGRNPYPEEWRGHTMHIGEDLRGVVGSFTGSLEFARRGMAGPASAASPVLTQIEGFHIYTDEHDAAVGSMVRTGTYEPEVCTQFRAHLRPGMRVLDIGANIGFFSLLSASLTGSTGHVLAVEPNAGNVRLLEASRRRNGFANITVLQVAAGRDHGLLMLNTSYSNGTTAPLPDSDEAVLASVTVPAIRLDALLTAGQRVDFVKIDVEGAEYTALLGCEAMLRRDHPVIVSEFSPGLMPGISGIDGPGYLRWLTALGYDLSVVCPDGTLAAAGPDVEHVMQIYESRVSDHVDILAVCPGAKEQKFLGPFFQKGTAC